jgi:solute carrier family 34 (sodium-dependent phosphate cotransporter)
VQREHTADPAPRALPADAGPLVWVRRGRIILVAVFALWIFLVGLSTMKTGAGALAPALDGSTFTDSLPSTLGLGWLSAMLVMSGSPIAASSLALLDAGSLTRDETFVALTGSRLGASFVVLLVAFIYALRSRGADANRGATLSVGIIALLLTAVAYLPGALVGLTLLRSGSLGGVDSLPLAGVEDVVAAVTDPAVNGFESFLPDAALFFLGLALLLAGLKLFDAVLPTPAAGRFATDGWRDNRWIMFAIGSGVAFVTMSVSVALTVLVPAVAKGFLRRRQAIPYIAGANVTTLADTLLTAVLLGNADAVRVVLAELLGVGAITILLLAFLYGPLQRSLIGVTDGILRSRVRLGAFVLAVFAIPVTLVLAFG